MLPAADSAGQPFAGRSFEVHPFAGDTGDRDPVLDRALQDFSQAVATLPPAAADVAFGKIVDSLAKARLLIPLIAEAGDLGLTEQGLVVEKTQELSVVHVEGPDGRAVAPVFSSVSAMSVWKKDARPVPVEASRAALAAVAEGLGLMVLDPGSAHSVVLRRSALQAVATGEAHREPVDDPAVQVELAHALEPHRDVVVSHEFRSGDTARKLEGPEIMVWLALAPGLSPNQFTALVEDISATWQGNPLLQARVDGLGIKVIPA